MTKEAGSNKKFDNRNGRWIIYTTIPLMILFVLSLYVLISYAERLFSKSLSETIYFESKGLYSMEYADLDIDIFGRSLILTEFRLVPDTISADKGKQDLYDVYIEKLTLANLRPRPLLRDRILELDKFLVEKPVLAVIKSKTKTETDTIISSRKEFRDIIHKYLKDIKIETLEIEKGIFDMLIPSLDSANSSIGSISLVLYDFQIKEGIHEDTTGLFYSRDADLMLHNYAYQLEEIEHELIIERVLISSQRRLIEFDSLKLFPLKPDSLGKKFWVGIPALRFSSVHIDKLLESQELWADSLTLNKPGFKIQLFESRHHSKNDTGNHKPRLRLPPELKLLKTNNFSLEEASFNYRDSSASENDQIVLKKFRFAIDSLLLDSSNNYDRIRQSIANHAQLGGRSFTLNLSSLKHKLEFDSLFFSARQGKINAQNMQIEPIKGHKPSATGNISSFRMNGFDLQDFIDKQKLLCGSLAVDHADLLFEAEQKSINKDSSFRLNYFYFDSLQFTKSKLKINVYKADNLRFSFDSGLDIFLNAFAIDTNRLAGDNPIELAFAQLSLKRPLLVSQNKFRLSSDVLDFNSGEGYLSLRSLHFDTPENSSNPDFRINELNLSGIDMQSYIDNNSTYAYKLNIKKPLVSLPQSSETKKSVSAGELQKQISGSLEGQFNSLRIGFIDINDLAIEKYQSESKSAQTLIDDTQIRLKNFDLRTDEKQRQNPLFSEDISLNISNYEDYSSDKTFKFSLGNLSFSRSKRRVELNNFRIQPAEPGKDGTHIMMEDIQLLDFNFDQFYFENTLIADEFRVKEPTFEIRRISADTHQSTGTIVLPDFAETLSLGKIVISDADFAFINETDSVLFTCDLNFEHIYHHPGENIRLFKDKLPFRNFDFTVRNFAFKKGEESLSAKFGKAQYSTSTRKLSATDLQFENFFPDPKTYLARYPNKSLISVELPELDVFGLDFNDFYLGKKVDASKIEVDHLQIKTYAKTGQEKVKNTAEDHEASGFLKLLAVKLLDVNKLDLDFYHFSGDTLRSFGLKGLEGRMEGFSMDSTQKLKEQLYNAKNFSIFKDDFTYLTADSMYRFSAKNISLSSEKGKLTFTDFQLTPRYPRYEFSRRLGYQTDRLDIAGEKVEVSGVDFFKDIETQSIKVNEIKLDNFTLDLFRDKRVDFPEWHKSPMPQQLLKQLKIPLVLKKVDFNNFTVRYAEMVEGAGGPGEIHFADMNGALTNVTNVPEMIGNNPIMKLDLSASLMGESTMNALLKLHLDSPGDTFSFYGSLDKVDLSVFNPLSEKLFGVAIKKGIGRVDSIMIFGNSDYEVGHLLFPYQKFRIQMIDRKTGRTGGIGDGLMTFLANNILLKSNNPRAGRPLRHGMIFFQRDTRKSIFNYLWKGILSGVESTLGYNKRQQRKKIRVYKEALKNNN